MARKVNMLLEFETVDINNYSKDKKISVQYSEISKLSKGYSGGTRIDLKSGDSFTIGQCLRWTQDYIAYEIDKLNKVPEVTLNQILEAHNKTNKILEDILNKLGDIK